MKKWQDGKVFELEVLNGEEVTGKTKASLTRFIYTDSSALNSPTQGVSWYKGGNHHMRGLWPASGKRARREGQDELSNSAFFSNSSSPRFLICPDAIIQVCPGPIYLLNTNFHIIKSLWVEFTMCSDQELCQYWPSYFCNLPLYRKRS